MEHPHLHSGVLVPSDPAVVQRLGLYERREVDGAEVIGMLTPSEEALRRHEILSVVFALHPVPVALSTETWHALNGLKENVSRRRVQPDTVARLRRLLADPRQTVADGQGARRPAAGAGRRPPSPGSRS